MEKTANLAQSKLAYQAEQDVRKIYNRFMGTKILLYREHLEAAAAGQLKEPLLWHIYPTNFCPQNCSFCIMSEEKRKNPVALPRDILLKAVREAAESGAVTIHFSGGGEPLAHPDIIDAMALARLNGLKVALSTNGVLIDRFGASAIVGNVDYFRLSLNASTEEMHTKVSGLKEPFWDRILKNLEEVVKLGKGKMDIGVAYLLTVDNWQGLWAFCHLMADMNVDFVHIRPAYYADPELDRQLRSVRLDIARLAKAAEEDVGSKLEIYVRLEKFRGYWTPRTYTKCRATPLIAVLKANARFIPCQDRLDLEFGDYKTQSFREIWFSQEHKDIIADIDLSKCPRCVEGVKNEIIEHVFLNDRVRRYMI